MVLVNGSGAGMLERAPPSNEGVELVELVDGWAEKVANRVVAHAVSFAWRSVDLQTCGEGR